jgi:hypothetical protein
MRTLKKLGFLLTTAALTIVPTTIAAAAHIPHPKAH